MTENNILEQPQTTQPVQSDKELNFRKLEQKYQRELAEAKSKAEEAERRAQELMRNASQQDDEDVPDDYVDYRKLNKKLAKVEDKAAKIVQSEVKTAVQQAIYEERANNWLRQNSDFNDVMKHADKLYEKDPEFAETILQMPDNFERQKLVYKSIKNMGLDKPPQKQPSIQDKIDANRRSPYYQPTGISGPGYAMQGDFSNSGQKNAYDKMKELQKNIRF